MWKAAAVEREAAAIYRRHDAEAARRGIRALHGEELQAAVRHHLGRWPPHDFTAKGKFFSHSDLRSPVFDL